MKIAVSEDVYNQTLAENPEYAQHLTVNGKRPRQQAAQKASSSRRPDSPLESKFADYWRMLGGPELERDYRGWSQHNPKWEIDFYHKASKTGFEIQGGTAQKPVEINGKWYQPISGHNSAKGYGRDCRKQISARSAGIHLISISPTELTSEEAPIWISALIMSLKG